MTSWVVYDSSIVIATALRESHTPEARGLMQHLEEQNLRLAAPTLFHYKIVSVVRKHVFRATLTSDEAETILTDLLLIPVQLMLDDALIRRAYELATQFNRPTAYDAQYLAVAERLNCDFWTADEKLFNAVRDGLNWVKWVGNFESETRQ